MFSSMILVPVHTTYAQWQGYYTLNSPAEADCIYWFGVNPMACAASTANIALQITSYLVGISGGLMDIAINQTVVEMADWVDSIDVVDAAWEILRDIANLTFIFILLYIAIQTILGLNTQSTYQAIAYTIMIGLLMNFSLFFTQVVIDTSNVIATRFYDNIKTEDPSNTVATQLLASVKLPSVYGNPPASSPNPTWGQIFVTGFGGVVLFIIVAFSFLAVSILLIIRFVILIMLMILSPLAFTAYILPKTRGYFMMWLDRLLKECFWVPAYFVLLYIAMRIAATLHQAINTSGGDLNNALANPTSPGGGETLLHFFVIIFFFVAALIISQKVGATGASTAVSIGSKWGKSGRGMLTAGAGAATMGAAGFAGRQSIGRLGAGIAESEALKGAQARGGLRGLTARAVRGTGSKMAQSSFDVRATSAGGGVAGALGLGKAGGKGGFEKSREEYVKKQQKIGEELAPSKALMAETETAALEAQRRPQREREELAQAQASYERRLQQANQSDTPLAAIERRSLENEGELLQRRQQRIESQEYQDQLSREAASARQSADRLAGVDVKKMKERLVSDRDVLQTLETSAEQVNAMNQEQLQRLLDSEGIRDVREAKGLIFHQPEGERRVEQFTQNLEQRAAQTGFRAGIVRAATLKSKRDRSLAAAAVRKTLKQKTSGDQLLDIIRNAPEFTPPQPPQPQGGQPNPPQA